MSEYNLLYQALYCCTEEEFSKFEPDYINENGIPIWVEESSNESV